MRKEPGPRVLSAKARRALLVVLDGTHLTSTGELFPIAPWLSYQQLADFARIMATPARRTRK